MGHTCRPADPLVLVEAAVSCWQEHMVSSVLLPSAALKLVLDTDVGLRLEALSTPIFLPQNLSALPCQ